jgi:menaquinol-cytochrome c reductase iron-sulfur subunit
VSDKRAKQKSKYTLDRGIPGAFEGETVTRRRFMTGTAHTAGAIAAARSPCPALGFALGPIFKSTPHRWETVGTVGHVRGQQLHPRGADRRAGIGEAGKTTVYVRKFNPEIDTDPYDKGTPYIAISSRCAHLGCPVRWVDAAERFICPCHGGVYDLLGKRVGGPPVRPLDRFYTRVVGENVQVGPRFSVNSELRRFSPARPGRAAGRRRPVPVPVAPRRAETLSRGTAADAEAAQAPSPPDARRQGAAARAPGEENGPHGPIEPAKQRASRSSTGSTSAPR